MKYRAIFFDWDGTAVESRTAPADEAVKCMKPLLQQGIRLIIISGTTYENIAGGRLHQYFTPDELKSLFLGLGRGAYNYGFREGRPELLSEKKPDMQELVKIHRAAYRLHEELLTRYGIGTDIVFCRPNYCKVDMMADCDRGDRLFLQQAEIDQIRERLEAGGLKNGLRDVLKLAEELGLEEGIRLKATTDAKYVEIGLGTKSDNVDYFMDSVLGKEGITAEECCFWGDEFCYLADGIPGSDAYMMTEKTKNGRFFDVSPEKRPLPEKVEWMGGGIHTFHDFLQDAQK